MKHGVNTLKIYLRPELAEQAAAGSLSGAAQAAVLQNLTEIYTSMAAYVPRSIRSDQARLEKGVRADRTLMLADVTGFTTLSERLSRIGKEGAEEVTGIINSYFSPIIKIVGNYGGDVICFIGDALSISFSSLPGEKSPHQLRALKAAQEIQDFVKNFTEVKTSAGVFNLNLHLALHCGQATDFRLGAPAKGLYYLIAGAAANRVSAIEDLAEIGDILVSDELAGAVTGKISAGPKGQGAQKFIGISAAVEPAAASEIKAPQDLEALVGEMELMRPYLSSWVLQKIVADPKAMGSFGEHRRVTAVFLNLWGLDFDGDAQAVSKMQNYFAVLQDTVEKYGGAINKIDFSSTGQRALILFGAPITYENNDERAVLCALEMLAHEEFKFGGVKQRFGINSGYVYAGTIGSARRREFTVMGDEVNLAARLMGQAAEDQLLVTASVYRKTQGKFEAANLGEKEFKGKSLPVTIYQVLKKAEAADSIFAKWISESKSMVGRQREKEVLNGAIDKVMTGKGQIVAVVGEPGIGKSRLGRELAQMWLEHGYTMFGGNCQSYGQAISYLPWADLFESYLGTKKLPTMEEKAAKIEKMLAVIDPALKDWAPIVGELVGVWIPETNLTKSLDPKLRQQRLFDLVLDILTWGASQEPLLLVLEDLHWADNASMALLNYVARN
ncbi:MAG TPA: adenylate/guanylate cyclase domain-containing protein, partial [Candidatus Edwardsbacteria bacterium]|nr:adenylate/guanylate cyclase domain-containing protein [Candidatus Edwardsbacteria bacterium]